MGKALFHKSYALNTSDRNLLAHGIIITTYTYQSVQFPMCMSKIVIVFRNLREMFKLDAADYMMSICDENGLRELSSPGKSGSIFYLSHDGRFVIKTLKKPEVKV